MARINPGGSAIEALLLSTLSCAVAAGEAPSITLPLLHLQVSYSKGRTDRGSTHGRELSSALA